MGKRISKTPETQNTPKPLPPSTRKQALTFVDWHLQALAAAGATEIYLVGSQAMFGKQTRWRRSTSRGS